MTYIVSSGTLNPTIPTIPSQFDDPLIIGYGKMMTGFKKFEFHNPNRKTNKINIKLCYF